MAATKAADRLRRSARGLEAHRRARHAQPEAGNKGSGSPSKIRASLRGWAQRRASCNKGSGSPSKIRLAGAPHARRLHRGNKGSGSPSKIRLLEPRSACVPQLATKAADRLRRSDELVDAHAGPEEGQQRQRIAFEDPTSSSTHMPGPKRGNKGSGSPSKIRPVAHDRGHAPAHLATKAADRLRRSDPLPRPSSASGTWGRNKGSGSPSKIRRHARAAEGHGVRATKAADRLRRSDVEQGADLERRRLAQQRQRIAFEDPTRRRNTYRRGRRKGNKGSGSPSKIRLGLVSHARLSRCGNKGSGSPSKIRLLRRAGPPRRGVRQQRQRIAFEDPTTSARRAATPWRAATKAADRLRRSDLASTTTRNPSWTRATKAADRLRRSDRRDCPSRDMPGPQQQRQRIAFEDPTTRAGRPRRPVGSPQQRQRIAFEDPTRPRAMRADPPRRAADRLRRSDGHEACLSPARFGQQRQRIAFEDPTRGPACVAMRGNKGSGSPSKIRHNPRAVRTVGACVATK